MKTENPVPGKIPKLDGTLPSATPTEFNPNEIDFVRSADEVARRAYFSYVNQGLPSGPDVQHWLEAEAELIAERNRTRVHGFHPHAQTKTHRPPME